MIEGECTPQSVQTDSIFGSILSINCDNASDVTILKCKNPLSCSMMGEILLGS